MNRTELEKAVVEKLQKELDELKAEFISMPRDRVINEAYVLVNAGDFFGAFERHLGHFEDAELEALLAYDGCILQCRDIRDSEADDDEMLYVWDEAIYNYCDVED